MLKGRSKNYGLFKACKHLSWEKCECPWLGRHKHVRYINLGEWAGVHNPNKTRSLEILADAKKAIKGGTFQRTAPREQGSALTFSQFIQLYRTHLVEDKGIKDTKNNSLHCMLRLWEEELGHYPLATLANSSLIFEDWLKARSKGGVRRRPDGTLVRWHKWSGNVPWNRYRAHGQAMFKWAMRPKVNLVQRNPFADIDRKQEIHNKPPRLGDVGVTEQQILDAIIKTYPPTPDHPKLDALNAHRRMAMERRLVGAMDLGLRLEELREIKVSDINYKTWEITLPTSKGKTKTGEVERVFAMTPRLRTILESRRFLKAPRDYVFGWEDGRRQMNWRKAWHSVFATAGLKTGRGNFVWHSLRHEFISSIAEHTDNVQEVMELARQRNISTTAIYMKAKEERLKQLLEKRLQA